MTEAPPLHSLGSLITKTKWLVDAQFNRLLREAGLDVTPEQFAVLITVHHNPGVSQTEIARRGYKEKTNVSRIVETLVKRGLLVRREDGADRRAFRIYLTEEGERLNRRIFPTVARLNETASATLTTSELQRLLDLLESVRAALEMPTTNSLAPHIP